MPQPTRFTPPYDFSAAGVAQGNKFDVTFQAIKTTLDQIISNLALIQRDDGLLKNGSVHTDSLTKGLFAMIAAGEGEPRGNWLAGEFYRAKDTVAQGGQSHLCAFDHYASNSFANDSASGAWLLLQSVGSLVSAVSTTLTPTGSVGSTNVQNAIAELDAEKATLAGSSGQAFSVAPATAATHAAQLKQAQDNSLRFLAAAGTGNAMTATLTPSALSALVDGMELFVRAPGSNTVVSPTLNVTLGATPTGPVSICRSTDGTELAVGAIAGASHILHLIYSAPLLKWQLLNPAA